MASVESPTPQTKLTPIGAPAGIMNVSAALSVNIPRLSVVAVPNKSRGVFQYTLTWFGCHVNRNGFIAGENVKLPAGKFLFRPLHWVSGKHLTRGQQSILCPIARQGRCDQPCSGLLLDRHWMPHFIPLQKRTIDLLIGHDKGHASGGAAVACLIPCHCSDHVRAVGYGSRVEL